MTLHPLTGTLIALLIAWASILLAIRLPLSRWLDLRTVRLGGALALTALALHLLGLPVPTPVSLVILLSAVIIAAAQRLRGHERR